MRSFRRLIMFIFLSTIIESAALSGIPYLINIQGFLVNDTGPVSGYIEATFRIYDAPSGGTSLWEETDSIAVNDGLYSTILGQQNPIDIEQFHHLNHN